MKRRLLRPAIVVPALVALSLAAGIGYAAWTQLGPGRADANERLLASLPVFPGAEEVERVTRTSADGSLPVPDSVVTNVLYAPPPGTTQADVLEFYVGALAPAWTPQTTTVRFGEDGEEAPAPTAFRVDFSRGDDCVRLLTYGLAPGHIGEPTFAVSAESGQGPCAEL